MNKKQNLKKKNKSQIWVSAVLYLLVTLVVMFIILDAGIPLVQNMRDKTIFTRTKDNFINLDQRMKTIIHSEPGSQEVIPIDVKKGEITFTKNAMLWSMDTDANIIEPKTEINTGTVKLLNNIDVSASVGGDTYLFQNSYIKLILNKYGDDKTKTYVPINTTKLIKSVMYLSTMDEIDCSKNSVNINVGDFPNAGTGYTELLGEGDFLKSATYVAHINTTMGRYKIIIKLDSVSDFVIINSDVE